MIKSSHSSFFQVCSYHFSPFCRSMAAPAAATSGVRRPRGCPSAERRCRLVLRADGEPQLLHGQFPPTARNLTSKSRGWVRDMMGAGVWFVQWPDFETVARLLAHYPDQPVYVRTQTLQYGQLDLATCIRPAHSPQCPPQKCVCAQHGMVRSRKATKSAGFGRRVCSSDVCLRTHDLSAFTAYRADPVPAPVTEAQWRSDVRAFAEGYYSWTPGCTYPMTDEPIDLHTWTGSFTATPHPSTSASGVRPRSPSPAPARCSRPRPDSRSPSPPPPPPPAPTRSRFQTARRSPSLCADIRDEESPPRWQDVSEITPPLPPAPTVAPCVLLSDVRQVGCPVCGDSGTNYNFCGTCGHPFAALYCVVCARVLPAGERGPMCLSCYHLSLPPPLQQPVPHPLPPTQPVPQPLPRPHRHRTATPTAIIPDPVPVLTTHRLSMLRPNAPQWQPPPYRQ